MISIVSHKTKRKAPPGKVISGLMSIFIRVVTIFLSSLSALVLSQQIAIADVTVLRVGGTGGDLGTMRLLGRAYEKRYPDARVNVLPSLGSKGGIKALLAGKLDLGLSARPLKEKEVAAGALAQAYGKTPVVFATNPANSADNISGDDLVAMFSGELRQWPDGSAVRLVLRHGKSADEKIIVAAMPHMKQVFEKGRSLPGVPVAYTIQDAAQRMETARWGLGMTNLSVILGENRGLKALRFNDVNPSPENLSNHRYPLEKTFYFVTHGAIDEKVRHFINFVFSPEGVQILEETGHLVLLPNETGRK